jgi:hypothetical protein
MYLAIGSNIVRNSPSTFGRERPFYIMMGISKHFNFKWHSLVPVLKSDVGPWSRKITPSNQNNILSAAYSRATFPSERKPLIDVPENVFTKFPQSFRVLALGWNWKA